MTTGMLAGGILAPCGSLEHRPQRFSGCALILVSWASLVAQTAKNPPAMQETRVLSLVGKIPWRREWLPTPVFLPGDSHGQRSLAGSMGSQRVGHG